MSDKKCPKCGQYKTHKPTKNLAILFIFIGVIIFIFSLNDFPKHIQISFISVGVMGIGALIFAKPTKTIDYECLNCGYKWDESH